MLMATATMWSDIAKVAEGMKPAMLMVTVQLTFAVVNVLYKLSVYDGMNVRVLIAYRFIFASAFMAPLAFLFDRSTLLLLYLHISTHMMIKMFPVFCYN